MEKRGYVVTHTHWDREWRYPIWESNIYLAQMVDELLDVLDTQPDYAGFLFDGQSVFLEDYLKLRPQNRERIEKHIQNKRLLIGPWYTLPDLYPVSGESLVRNLLKGDRVCREYGHKLQIGYESFGWGQPSQFPQIYKGFGIDLVIVAKRVAERRAPESEFCWEGKDGTKVLATRLGKDARANFYMNTYLEAMSGRRYKSDEFRYEYGKERLYHRADKLGSEQDFFMLTHGEEIHEDKLRELGLLSWEAMADSVLKNDRVMMDGSDSTSAQVQILPLIRKLNEAMREDGITLQHTTLEAYGKLLREKLDINALRCIKGELRDGPSPSLSANALMTRFPVKQAHRTAESLLMKAAEPLSCAASMAGLSYDRLYLEMARDELLRSQSHDSINGVVQDKTVRDVMYRLDQSRELSGCVKEGAIRYFVQELDNSSLDPEDILLLLVNPLPAARREVIDVIIDTPAERNIWDLSIEDLDGNVLDTAHLSRKETATPTVNRNTRPEPYYADRHHMLLDTGLIPAGGYKVVRAKAKQSFDRKQKFWPPTRMSGEALLASSATTMENAYIKVQVQPNGTLRILNKETGYCFADLNYLESEGDVGDYWIYYPPYENPIYSSTGVQAVIRLEENSPLRAVICASYDWEVPADAMRPEGGIQGNSCRSRTTVKVPVTVRYILKKDAKMVEVELKIRNTAKDHRVAVKFHTGIETDTAYAKGHFCVDARPVLADREENGLRYTELDKLPMQGFVNVADGKAGFAVVSADLLEYDASVSGELSCTLFRAVRNIICTEFRSGSSYPSQEGGQLQQELVYRYGIVCHTGDWENAQLLSRLSAMEAPVIPVQFSAGEERSGTLPLTASFYEVTGAEVSCFKQAEDRDSLILRLYHPGAKVAQVKVKLGQSFKQVYQTNMNEDRMDLVAEQTDCVTLTLQPDEIKTLEFVRD